MLQSKSIHVTTAKEVITLDIIIGIIEKAHEVSVALVSLGIAILTVISVIKAIIHSMKK